MKRWALLLGMMTAASLAWAGAGKMRAIEMPEAGSPLAAVALDAVVYGASRPDLADLRVTGPRGDVPYSLWSPSSGTPYRRLPATVTAKSLDASGSRLTLDMGASYALERIDLDTTQVNFVRKANVLISDDGTDWKTLREGVVVHSLVRQGWNDYLKSFAVHEYPDLMVGQFGGEDLSIEVPPSTARFVRIDLPATGAQDPVELTGAALFKKVRPDVPEDVWTGVMRPAQVSGDGRSTEVVVDFGRARLPFERVEIDVAQDNFSRPVRVEISDDAADWTPAGSAVLLSASYAEIQRQERTVPLAGAAGRYLKLTFHNADNPPLPLRAVTGYAKRRYVVFTAQPGHAYWLRYGDPSAARPSYDVAPILAESSLDTFRVGRLGAEQDDPSRTAGEEPALPKDGAGILWAALGVMMAGLLFLAYQMVRRSDAR